MLMKSEAVRSLDFNVCVVEADVLLDFIGRVGETLMSIGSAAVRTRNQKSDGAIWASARNAGARRKSCATLGETPLRHNGKRTPRRRGRQGRRQAQNSHRGTERLSVP